MAASLATAARRLLIGVSRRDSRLCKKLTADSAGVAIDRLFRPTVVIALSKPATRSSHLLCSLKVEISSKTEKMVNETTVISENNGHSCQPSELDQPTWKEINIPMPFGHLAAKVWGKPNNRPVLALHGWQDNAGTFDKLIPMLPQNLYVVCLDFIGHGLSSHYPAGLMYHFWDHISHVHLVAAHFGWTKFSILGHSMGGIVGSIFTSVSPQMVDRLIMIDIVKPISIPAKFQPEKSVKAIESYLQVLKKLEQGPPSYPYEAARQRLLQANNGSVDVEAADVLMRRGTKRNEDGGYYFARDLRHVIPSVASYTAEQHAEYAKRVHCPVLIIKAKNGFIYEDKAVIEDFINIYRESSHGGFQYAQVEGTHHVHLVTPENVAPVIGDFLSAGNADEVGQQPEN